MSHQKTEDRGQRTEALSRLRRAFDASYRIAAHNNLSFVSCLLSSVPGGTQ